MVLVESLEKEEVMEAQPVRSEPKNGQAAGRGWWTERLCRAYGKAQKVTASRTQPRL